jgi:hypothetical protein
MVRNNTYACSTCSFAYTVKSINPNLLICPQCNSIIQNLTGQKLIVPLFPANWSFVKIGAKGNWKEKTFEVIGRVKLQLLNSYKNAWYILYDDGTSGWLMDGLGSLSIVNTRKQSFEFEDIKKLRPGKSLNLDNRSCEIVSMEECERVMYEGEIGNWTLFKPGFFVAEGLLYNQASVSFFLNIPKKEIMYLEGEKATLENLKAETLIKLDEWR